MGAQAYIRGFGEGSWWKRIEQWDILGEIMSNENKGIPPRRNEAIAYHRCTGYGSQWASNGLSAIMPLHAIHAACTCISTPECVPSTLQNGIYSTNMAGLETVVSEAMGSYWMSYVPNILCPLVCLSTTGKIKIL
jgi:hypothetical protein